MKPSNFRTFLGAFAVAVWVLAALPTWTRIERPSARESPEQIAAFEHRFTREILPTYRTLGENGYFESQGFKPDDTTPKRKIHYRLFRRTHFSESMSEKGAIVISPDRGEQELQYAEVVHDLTSAGYSVYVLDHRGNGLSDRLLSDRTRLHVDRFLDYSADFRKFVDEVVKPESHRDLYLLCHSMGCAVAAPFLASNPRLFRAIAMSAPMFELKKGFTEDSAYDYDLAFERNLKTGSWMRFHKERELLMDIEQLAKQISHRRLMIALGGPTPHWIQETRSFLKDLEVSELWRSPTLMLQAENDAFVGADAQERVCDRLAETGCRLVRIGGAFHDLLQERDTIRSAVLGDIEGFFENNSTKTVHRLDS